MDPCGPWALPLRQEAVAAHHPQPSVFVQFKQVVVVGQTPRESEAEEQKRNATMTKTILEYEFQ